MEAVTECDGPSSYGIIKKHDFEHNENLLSDLLDYKRMCLYWRPTNGCLSSEYDVIY